MIWNRETIAVAVVGAGGAWMVGLALFNNGVTKLNAVQRRGLLLSGVGFIACAASARWLQSAGAAGMACSLAGTAIAMTGMYQLMRERADRRASRNTDTSE
jgi:predicted phage tail protein